MYTVGKFEVYAPLEKMPATPLIESLAKYDFLKLFNYNKLWFILFIILHSAYLIIQWCIKYNMFSIQKIILCIRI